MKLKKLAAGVLALSMIFAMAAPTFAEGYTSPVPFDDNNTFKIYRDYALENSDKTSPVETITLTPTPHEVKQAEAGVTKENMPNLTVSALTAAAGDAGSEAKKFFEVELPDYTSVGKYVYKLTETAGNKAGVTYNTNELYVTVTVVNDNIADGTVKVKSVSVRQGSLTGDKESKIDEKYSAGVLNVTKEVSGELANTTDEFTVNVTFTAPAGKEVGENITYNDGEDKTITPEQFVNGVATVRLTVKHGSNITFNNVPYGVTYTVEEAANTLGYTASYNFSDISDVKTMDSAAESVAITNTKGDDTPDMGVLLDTAPYMLVLTMVAGAAVTMVVRRRREED